MCPLHPSGRSQYSVMLAIYRDLGLGLPQSAHQASGAANKIRKPVHMGSGNAQSGTMTGFFRVMTDVKPHFFSHAEAREADMNMAFTALAMKGGVYNKRFFLSTIRLVKTANRGRGRGPWTTKTHSSANETPSLFVPCVHITVRLLVTGVATGPNMAATMLHLPWWGQITASTAGFYFAVTGP